MVGWVPVGGVGFVDVEGVPVGGGVGTCSWCTVCRCRVGISGWCRVCRCRGTRRWCRVVDVGMGISG